MNEDHSFESWKEMRDYVNTRPDNTTKVYLVWSDGKFRSLYVRRKGIGVEYRDCSWGKDDWFVWSHEPTRGWADGELARVYVNYWFAYAARQRLAQAKK